MELPISLLPPSARMARDAALLPVRAAIGATMLVHGTSKLRGDGAQQQAGFFEQVGLRPGKPLVVATGIAETFAGISALLGLWTRPGALAILVTQGMAIAKVHGQKGFEVTKGGYEFNLALMGIALALLIGGPGLFSAHEGIERLAEGRGARKWLRRSRPRGLLRLIKLLK